MNVQNKPSEGLSGIRTLGQLLSRTRLGRFLGQSFGGSRDYYEIFGYKRTLVYQDMLAKYARQGIASRIVEAPAQGLWDNPPEVRSNNDEWNAAWARIVSKTALWQQLLAVDKLAGMGRYSTLLIGVSGARSLESPANGPLTNGNLREVLYLQPYSQESSEIDSLNSDQSSPNYLKPEVYTMYPFRQDALQQGPRTTITTSSFKAHATRVLHVAENVLENTVFGFPRLERVFNDLDDLAKVTGGSAEAFWLIANRGMQIDVDKEMELSPEDAQDLSDEIKEYQHGLRRFLRTRGVTVNPLGADAPEPEETFNMTIAVISGGTRIPRRILTGSEAGQLASEQDRANWSEYIEQRGVEFGQPMVMLPLISKLTALGALPSSPDLEITITWPEAFRMSPLERAQQAAQHARSYVNFVRGLESAQNLTQSIEGSDGQLDEEGNIIPGTAVQGRRAVLGSAEDILTIAEMRQFMEVREPAPGVDDPDDLPDPGT